MLVDALTYENDARTCLEKLLCVCLPGTLEPRATNLYVMAHQASSDQVEFFQMVFGMI
jgi:hypothetical protein